MKSLKTTTEIDLILKIFSCFLKNIKMIFCQRKLRFYFDKKQSLFCLKEKEDNFYFSENQRGFKHYKFGLKLRGHEIANSYGIDLVKFKKSDIVFDCGANVGDLFIFLKDKINHNNYFAFEPSINDFSALSINAPFSNCFQIGLSNTKGQEEFYLSTKKGDSSIVKPKRFTGSITINTNTIDNIFESHGIDKLRLLKIEAEGYEPEILDGAIKSLNKVDYIAIDGGYERGVSQEETLSLVLNKLYPLGFYIIFLNLRLGRALLKSR